MRDPLDLAIVATAIVGGLIGFLWWNTNPAKIYMGDTGSLALGGALAALAIVSHTELLLLLIGGLFVIETGSVIVQRAYFKLTRGKRIFLMSPIHHHFELQGLGRGHDRRALLDHRRPARRRGRRRLLLRVAAELMSDAAAVAARLDALTSWNADWRGLRVAVLGLGVTGFAVADTLTELGADVLVVAPEVDDDRARILDVIGARLLRHPLDAVPAELVDVRARA